MVRTPRPGFGVLLARISGVAGSTALAQAVTGVVYVLAARGLGPAAFGRYAIAIAVATIAVVVFDLGLNNLLVREVAAGRLAEGRARAAVGHKRRAALLLEILVVAACWAVLHDLLAAVGIGSIAWAQWEAQTGNALLRAREQFRAAYAAQVWGRLASLGLVLVLFAARRPEGMLAAGLLLGFLVETVVNRRALGPRPAAPDPTAAEQVALHREATSFGLLGLAASAQQLDTPLVALGGGAAAAGLYAAAGRLIGPLGLLGASLTSVAAPWLARARGDEASLRREERRVARATLLVAVGPAVAGVSGPWLLPLLLGPAYAASGATFAVLAGGALFSALNQGLAVVLQNRGAALWVALSVAAGLALGLVATGVLAAIGGSVLAAVGYSVSQIVIVALLAVRMTAIRRTGRGVGRHRRRS